MIKKIYLTLILFFAPVVLFVPAAGAQVDITTDACSSITDPNAQPAYCREALSGASSNPIIGPDGILTRVASVLSIAVGLIAVIVMVIAGIKMSLSSGDPGKVAKARSQIIYALVGLVVALLSQAIVQLVLRNL